MNARERFLAVMNFQPGVHPPLWEFGYWAGALRRWYREGLPEGVGLPESIPDGEGVRAEGTGWEPGRAWERDVHNYLGLDEGIIRLPLNNYIYPSFQVEVLEDHGDWHIYRDEWGVARREPKDKTSLPAFVSAPVQNREDWEQLKAERLQPKLEGRLPKDWPQLLEGYRRRDYPLAIGGRHGFFGTPRYLLGLEKLLTSYYDDPQLIADMTSYLADFWVALYDQVLQEIKVDLALIWEDMAYKTGSLISPALFREFMLPGYQKLTALFRAHGIQVVWVDTDGHIWKLIPLFLEGGVTGLYPFEVAAGMDVVEVRKAFPKLEIMGGLDKMKVAAGPEAIDMELEARLPAMLERGGYIPCVDHNVPPDVSWANFLYYRRRLEKMVKG